MGESELGDTTCSDCGEPLDGEEGDPCPACGSLRRTVHLSAVSVGTSLDRATVTVIDWVGEHPRWSALAVGASVGGVVVNPFLGPIWGTIVGAAVALGSYLAGKKAVEEGRWPRK